MKTKSMQVSRFDWTMYHQAIKKARRQWREDTRNGIENAQANFTKACRAAYNRMLESADTELVEVNRYDKI